MQVQPYLNFDGRAEEAALCFASAYHLLADDAWLTRVEPDRLERLRQLGTERPMAMGEQA